MMKLEEIGTRARQAEPVLRIMETEKKNRVLKKAAENLVADAETIIAANALDMEHGKEKACLRDFWTGSFWTKAGLKQWQKACVRYPNWTTQSGKCWE